MTDRIVSPIGSSDLVRTSMPVVAPNALAGERWHVPELDGIRGVAIGTVFVGHLLIARRATEALGILANGLAGFGVSLFFVLSGFLITSLLLREERATGRIDIRGFYGRRFLRIFPVYFAYIFCVFVFDKLHVLQHVTMHDYVASAFFARNLVGHSAPTGHLWSLSLEEQFYLLWPTTLALVPNQSRRRFVATTLVVLTLWRVIVLKLGWYAYGALYERTDLRLDTILAGCALSVFGFRERVGRWTNLIVIGAFMIGLLSSGFSIVRQQWSALSYPLLSVSLTALLYGSIANRASAWSRVLRLAALRWLGRISYSLYLWHALFIGNLSDFPGRRPIPLGLGIVLSFVVAVASYRWIEQPIVRLKNSWAAKRAADEAAVRNAAAEQRI